MLHNLLIVLLALGLVIGFSGTALSEVGAKPEQDMNSLSLANPNAPLHGDLTDTRPVSSSFKKPETALRSVQMSGRASSHSTAYFCDLQYYYDDTATAVWVWSIPDAYGDDLFNMRFTVEDGHECTLMVGWILMYGDWMTGTPDMRIYLWDDDGFGFPGNKLDSADVPFASMGGGFWWASADWSAANWVFGPGEEYHIGWTTLGGDGDTLWCVSDKATGPHAGEYRSSENWAGFWGLMADDWPSAGDVAFFIESERCCSESFGHFIGHFMTPEGEPYPCDVVISDGEWVQKFDSVTYVETEVPPEASYRYTYQGATPDRKTTRFMDAIPVPIGQTREFVFYATDSMDVRSRPYIFFYEMGAEPSLSWDWNQSTGLLQWTLAAEPEHLVGLAVRPNTAESGPPIWYVAERKKPGGDPGCHSQVRIFWCLACWGSTCDVQTNVPMFRESVGTCQGYWDFDPVPADHGNLRINSLTLNGGSRVDDVEFVLQSTVTGQLLPSTWNPQIFMVPDGDYLLRIIAAPWMESGEISHTALPLSINSGVFRSIKWLLLTTDDLSPFTLSLVAQLPNGNAGYSNLFHDPGDSITVDVSNDCNCDWWGCFVLPDTIAMDQLLAYPDSGGVDTLEQLTDWTESYSPGFNLVTVRIQTIFDRLNLVYNILQARTVIEPDTMYAYWANAIEPIMGTVYLGDLTGGRTLGDLVASTIMINGNVAPSSVAVLASHPEFGGEVLEIEFPIAEFLAGYGLLWDMRQETYTVTGAFTDAASLTVEGNVTLIGHISGDLNVDGQVDIADLVYMVDYMFTGGPPPPILQLADLDCSGSTPDIADLVFLVDYMFNDGPAPTPCP